MGRAELGLTGTGRPMTKAELDERCEKYLEDRFGEKIDFAIENTLPSLLQDGLIVSTDAVWCTASFKQCMQLALG
jgi:hypothetical protein